MAKLPNAERAIIDAKKLYGYVLSPVHPMGRFKAAFFQNLGYSAESYDVFEQWLREVILSEEVVSCEDSPHGKKYVVEGSLVGAKGKQVQIVTVWIILMGEDMPRFITAYPGESR